MTTIKDIFKSNLIIYLVELLDYNKTYLRKESYNSLELNVTKTYKT